MNNDLLFQEVDECLTNKCFDMNEAKYLEIELDIRKNNPYLSQNTVQKMKQYSHRLNEMIKFNSTLSQQTNSRLKNQPHQSLTSEEQEQFIIEKNQAILNSLKNISKTLEDIHRVGQETHETLVGQGEKLRETYKKTEDIDQNISKSRYLIDKMMKWWR